MCALVGFYVKYEDFIYLEQLMRCSNQFSSKQVPKTWV